MGRNPKAVHKDVLPSNPSHPNHARWMARQGREQGQGRGTYNQAPAMTAPAVQENTWQQQQQWQGQQQHQQPLMQSMNQGIMAPGGYGQPPMHHQQSHQQNMHQQGMYNFTQGTMTGGMVGMNPFGPVF